MTRIILEKEPTFELDDYCPFYSGKFCLLATDVDNPSGYAWHDPSVDYNFCLVKDRYNGTHDFSKCPYCITIDKVLKNSTTNTMYESAENAV